MNKIENFINKWMHVDFNVNGVGGNTTKQYERFRREYKLILKDIAKNIGCTLHSFNKGFYEFSVVLETSDGSFIYVSVNDVRYFSPEWCKSVLYRSMKHDKDWSGGFNNYSTLTELQQNLENMIKKRTW